MRALGVVAIAALFALAADGCAASAESSRAVERGRNLFAEYLGVPEPAVDAKLAAAWHQLVAGDKDTQRLIYPLPDGTAYIPDLPHHDVRTEGLSYGMMIAVQLDHRREFDALWAFAKRYMWHETGPFRGYFAWHTDYRGKPLSAGPAPDGEEWFVMALFFASHRWGDGDGIFNYGREARALLHTMLNKHEQPDRGEVTDMFDRAAAQVVFAPNRAAATFTDPSYHLPAFYELWSQWTSDPADRAFIAKFAPTSRELFRRAAHPKTGLMPDYSDFDGKPHERGGDDNFEFDAWRTLANVALDYAWWKADPWQVQQSNRVLRFLATQGPRMRNRYQLDGTPISEDWSPGLQAMAGVAALAADRAVGEPFVRALWDLSLPEGEYRYYDGLLTMLGWLEVSGRFKIYGPANPPR